MCVNDHTSSRVNKFSYNFVDMATKFLQQGKFMSTIDISDAYHAAGFCWDLGLRNRVTKLTNTHPPVHVFAVHCEHP